ncbi:MAG: DUF2934 domain-containing protein [Nitrospirota bacterium]|nr:DUF2934 domain-containing protein [Nitrospirota bacterium]
MNRREKKCTTREISAVNGTPLTEELFERINRRAYELYELREGAHGHDAEDWLEAERQVREDAAAESQEKD